MCNLRFSTAGSTVGPRIWLKPTRQAVRYLRAGCSFALAVRWHCYKLCYSGCWSKVRNTMSTTSDHSLNLRDLHSDSDDGNRVSCLRDRWKPELEIGLV